MKPQVQLEPNSSGGLLVWKEPDPALKYVLAADTAGGLAKGDFAAGCVIEAESCDMVARWLERADPNAFGPMMAMLGWYYNEAMLAFETFPSAHGVTAANAAMKVGYKNVWRRTRMDAIKRTSSEILGWHTNATTKPQIINRIKAAMEEGCDIPDEVLLRQLREQRWSEAGEMTGRRNGHDDLLIAYGIALCVRDQCWTAGQLRSEPRLPRTASERYWMAWEARIGKAKKKPARSSLLPPWQRKRKNPWTQR